MNVKEYKIINIEEFKTKFDNLGYFTEYISDSSTIPDTSLDYFGYFIDKKFVIYKIKKVFLGRTISLKIDGVLQDKKLIVKIIYHNIWLYWTNFIFLIIFSGFVIWNLNYYIGIAILFVDIIQVLFGLNSYMQEEKRFIQELEKIIE